MKCPHCHGRNVEIGADGKAYCSDCMSELEGAEFTIHKERIIEQLEDFLDAVGEDDRFLALECIQGWVSQKAEVY